MYKLPGCMCAATCLSDACLNLTATLPRAPRYIKSAAIQMMRCLITLIKTLDQVPADRKFYIKLTYVEVRRCKLARVLDPSLKSTTRFQTLILKRV